MKKSLIPALVIAAGSVLGLASFGANAADGTITIIGKLSDSTCSINGSGPGTAVDFLVDLGTVSASALQTAGSTAGISNAADLTFNLTGCTAGTKAIAKFENGPNVDQGSGTLVNTTPGAGGGAGNVNVQLLNAALQPINIVTGTNNDIATDGATITGGAATLTYYARFISLLGSATAGAVDTSVQYTMTYQ
jgi:major type 1 subunit fimbrin (pilin)